MEPGVQIKIFPKNRYRYRSRQYQKFTTKDDDKSDEKILSKPLIFESNYVPQKNRYRYRR